MKKHYIKIIPVVMIIIAFILMPSTVFADVNACTPSTNDINKTNNWSHVDVISTGVGEITLDLVQPRNFYACFEYRTDGDTSQMTSPTNYNTCITDGLYPYVCLATAGHQEITLQASEYVEVRMVFGGESDERFDWTRFDVLQPKSVYGGGHILQENGDQRKDWYDISFGGLVCSAGSEGYMGDWQIVFHNVSIDDLDKAKFHGSNVTVMHFWDQPCGETANFTIEGTLNGESGYKVIFRLGDDPDNIRIELYQGSKKIYDSSDTAAAVVGAEFDSTSTCNGTARTELDNGDITIVQ